MQLGGSSSRDDGSYVLGDDALACLRDLRAWLKQYDGELNRLDVARCMAEANLVKGDLLEILAQWRENEMDNKMKLRMARVCTDLLTELTWPHKMDEFYTTMNHHRHLPYIHVAQIEYKKAILHFDRAEILRTLIRVALPSMALPRKERAPRDDNTINRVLQLFRNLVAINASPKEEEEHPEVSRSAAIDEFARQDVFPVLLTIASSMGTEYSTQDIWIMDILFHLLKGVDPEKLFMDDEKLAKTNTNELRELMQKEKAMLAGYARHAPTRHNRFGTMLWVKRDDERVSTVSGQGALIGEKALEAIDKSKKWNKPRFRGRDTGNDTHDNFDRQTPLSDAARDKLRNFVEEFLDSSFNPLFMHLRKAIEREAERLKEFLHIRQQFWYLVSWFLHAETARRRYNKKKAGKDKSAKTPLAADESFALIACVMNQETFILLNRHMQQSMDEKIWQDLNAAMKCFTRILLTVQEMSESDLEEDQEVAENIQNRIFYEETTHDRVILITRNYKGQGFGYLDACTELSHVFLRMLERYSKQNVDMQVRSKRRARKKRKEPSEITGEQDGDAEDETGDFQEAQRTVTERKFEFQRFAARFISQGSVDTFVAFTRYYNDLSIEQLKRAHRFFYRVAFKHELGVLLYRVDILQLFHKIIKGPEGLDPNSPLFKEWEEFTRQFFRRTIKKIQERPELVVEMLFSKINATMYYLEYGHDKEVTTRAPRPPAELEVRPGMEPIEQIGVAVGLLLNQTKADAIGWVKDVVEKAADERMSWEMANIAGEATNKSQEQGAAQDGGQPSTSDTEAKRAPSIFVKPDNDERRVAMFRDNKLRLLMTLVGMHRLGDREDPDASWIIPSSVTATELRYSLEAICKFEFAPPTYEDDKSPDDFIRTKKVPRSNLDFVDDEDEEGSGEDNFEFPAGGPTARKSEVLENLVQKRQRRRREGTPMELDDSEVERRAAARRQKDLEKRMKIKSELYVRDSDDETDEERDNEFFAREQAIREATGKNHSKALTLVKVLAETTKPKRKRKASKATQKSRKKRKGPFSDDESGDEKKSSDEDEGDAANDLASTPASADVMDVDSASEGDEETDTPLSSQQHDAAPVEDIDAGMDKLSSTKPSTKASVAEDSEDEDPAPVVKPARRAVRSGFVIESDSDE